VHANPLDPYVGLPYRAGGSDRDGCDCWGLVVLVYRELLGKELPLYSDYRINVADREEIAALLAGAPSGWTEVDGRHIRLFDLALMLTLGQEAHVGLVAGSGLVLHSSVQLGRSCAERTASLRFGRRVSRYARYSPQQ
jgi:cell wall-associated NlpC family hydrolase